MVREIDRQNVTDARDVSGVEAVGDDDLQEVRTGLSGRVLVVARVGARELFREVLVVDTSSLSLPDQQITVIIGAVAGAVVLLCCGAAVCFVVRRKRHVAARRLEGWPHMLTLPSASSAQLARADMNFACQTRHVLTCSFECCHVRRLEMESHVSPQRGVSERDPASSGRCVST